MIWLGFNRQSEIDVHDLKCQDLLRPQLCSVKQKINFCDCSFKCKLVSLQLALTKTHLHLGGCYSYLI